MYETLNFFMMRIRIKGSVESSGVLNGCLFLGDVSNFLGYHLSPSLNQRMVPSIL
jgi:hypothetical protein